MPASIGHVRGNGARRERHAGCHPGALAESTRVLAQVSNGKIDELITQNYKGDHEKMKQGINNIAVALQGLQKEMLRMSDFAKGGQLSERRIRTSSRARTRRL